MFFMIRPILIRKLLIKQENEVLWECKIIPTLSTILNIYDEAGVIRMPKTFSISDVSFFQF